MLRKYITNRNLLQTLPRYASTQAAAKFNLEQVHISEAIKLEPSLAIYAPEIWQRTHATFANHGLETVNFLRIVTCNPTIMQRTPERIINSMEIWRSCQFGEKFLHLLITKYPEFLDVTDSHSLLTYVAYLKSRLSTNKNIWKLLMNCPNLLEQKEQCVEEKLNYCIDVMHIEVPEIIKSAALAKQLSDIRCRHVFLERLGLFKPRPLKVDVNAPSTNHRLYQITDTSDKTFATKICHVTLPEFEAFQELYDRELKKKDRQRALHADEDDDDDIDDIKDYV